MIKISVIGVGQWGINHLRVFARTPGAEVVSICDADDATLGRAKALFPSIHATTDHRDAIDRAEAAVIATPAPTHHDVALAALKAGRHVLVEKPLSLSTADGKNLVQTAESSDRILMVGHLLLHHPVLQKLREIIRADHLGKPLYFYSQRTNLGRIRRDENVIWSLAPHDISMALFLFGESPATVSARGSDYLQKEIQDVAFLDLHYPDKRMAHIHVSWLDPRKERKLTIVGTEKMAVFDDMQSEEKLKIYDKGAEPIGGESAILGVRYGDISSPRVTMKEPLQIQALHFLECIREGKRPETDGRQGLEVLKILQACDQSLKKGGAPVHIPPPEDAPE